MSSLVIVEPIAAVSITNTANGSTPALTFTGLSIGAADASRIVIVTARSIGGGGATAITLNGTGMTARTAVGQTRIFTLAVAVGTTATFVVTAATNCVISVYSMLNAASAVPFDQKSVAANNTTLNIPANGVEVAAFASNNSATGATWTGLATKDTDLNLTGVEASTAHDSLVAAQTGRTISVASSGAIFALAAASWGP